MTAEYQPGVKVVYEKNADYVPRSEPPSGTAGGKVVKVDRVEWVTMPDAQTAVNALNAGEIDYIEQPPIDLLPLMTANNESRSTCSTSSGYQTMGRMNWLHPPFDNPKIRRAALLAIDQKDILGGADRQSDEYSPGPAAPIMAAARRWRPRPAPTALKTGGDIGGRQGAAEGGRL